MDDDARLRDVYYEPAKPGSFGSIKALSQASGVSLARTKLWLSKQMTYTLHKASRKRYVTRPYRTNKIDGQWQADLVEMIEFQHVNDGYRYLLTVIDLFSRYAWARALKSKSAQDVTLAFRSIISQNRRKPKKLQTDNGREFENAAFQLMLTHNNIRFFTISSAYKAAVVERFNRTLKGKMWKYFTHTGSHRWVDVLPRLMQSYNASTHRSIGMPPSQVNNQNEMELWEMQQNKGPQKVTQRDEHPVLQVGDSVRVSHIKKVFNKGYLPGWSDQVYTVSRVIRTPKIAVQFSGPVQYIIRDFNGENLRGSFYGFELQKIEPPERFRVQEVLRQRVRARDGVMEYFVRWMGYGEEFDSWVTDIGAIE
jgi:hypothetical protein